MAPPRTPVRSTADFVVRLVYVAFAPAVLAVLAQLLPMAGVFVNVGLALLVFGFTQVARLLAFRFRLVGKILSGAFRFDDFYRTHPPKPFAFYVFYPLMLPWVLYDRVARKELLLYRGFSVVALVTLSVGAGWDYFRNWQPELGPAPFLRIWIVTIAFQLVAILGFVMPLSSSIVAYRLAGRTRRLVSLLAVAALSVGGMAIGWSQKRHALQPLPTLSRLAARAAEEPTRARRAMEAALRHARRALEAHEGELASAGKSGKEVLGAPIDDARPLLATLFKEDEADAFHLVALPTSRGEVLVMYALPSRAKPPLWLGLTPSGAFVDDLDALPKGAVATMRNAVQK